MNLVRSLIASPKLTHHDPELGYLDLSYITPRLIVAAGPVLATSKKLHRYQIHTYVQFLERHHPRWRIWNLRAEATGYPAAEAMDRVSYYRFPDHEAPPFAMLTRCVASILEWLAQPDAVALIHCKAGKGRLGLVCCCVLMSLLGVSPFEANAVYTSKRMRWYSGLGVLILSQQRYLAYWYSHLGGPRPDQTFCVTALRVVGGKHLNLVVSTHHQLSHLLVEIVPVFTFNRQHAPFVVLCHPRVVVPGDIRLGHGLAYHWFNCNFETSPYRVSWHHFDGVSGTAYRGAPAFQYVEVSFTVGEIRTNSTAPCSRSPS